MELLQSVLSTSDEKSLPGIITFCSETKVFCNEKSKSQEIASLINALFSKVDTKEKALLILQAFIPQCPRDVLDSNILLWVQQCSKSLTNVEDGSINKISFSLIGDLLQLSTDFPEARKEIALSTIPKCLDHCIREAKNQKEDIQVVLQCLEQILLSYGKSSGGYKGEITSILFSLLESSPLTVYTSAKCYLYLAACGGPGTNNENYVNHWFLQQKFLLNMLHSLMDSLFENIDVHQVTHKPHDLGDYQPVFPKIIEKSLLRKKQRLASQFQSVAEFFHVYLLGSFPASKKVLPQSILSLVWRGLSVNCSTLRSTNVTADISNLSAVISIVNKSCLKILNAIITSCRKNLISYSSFICRMLSQILTWTNVQNWPYGVGKPHWALRVEAYLCVTNWLIVSQSSSGINKYIDDVLSSIISDIDMKPTSITLKVSSGKGKGKKHKQKKEVPIPLEFIVNKEENRDVCKAALDLIPVLLSSASTIMKSEQHKLLQELTVKKLFDLQNTRSNQAPVPYSCEDCRLCLYKALLSLCNYYHPSIPPPINYATNIFSKGMKDSSMKVMAFCAHSLINIEKVLKPPFLSLEFPTLFDDGSGNMNRKVISRDKYMVDRSFLNSTPVRDETTGHSFILNHEKSGIDERSRISDGYNESVSTDIRDHMLVDTDIREIISKPFHEKENIAALKENVSALKENKVEERCVEYVNDIVESSSSTICKKDQLSKRDDTNFAISHIASSSNSECNETEKKRNMEKNDDTENCFPKKVKMNGADEENSLTVEDSDEEMLNSFVDEVNES